MIFLLSVRYKQTSHIVDKLCPQHFKPRRHNLTISFGCLTPEKHLATNERWNAAVRPNVKQALLTAEDVALHSLLESVLIGVL